MIFTNCFSDVSFLCQGPIQCVVFMFSYPFTCGFFSPCLSCLACLKSSGQSGTEYLSVWAFPMFSRDYLVIVRYWEGYHRGNTPFSVHGIVTGLSQGRNAYVMLALMKCCLPGFSKPYCFSFVISKFCGGDTLKLCGYSVSLKLCSLI